MCFPHIDTLTDMQHGVLAIVLLLVDVVRDSLPHIVFRSFEFTAIFVHIPSLSQFTEVIHLEFVFDGVVR